MTLASNCNHGDQPVIGASDRSSPVRHSVDAEHFAELAGMCRAAIPPASAKFFARVSLSDWRTPI